MKVNITFVFQEFYTWIFFFFFCLYHFYFFFGKAQGQSLEFCGLYLHTDCFSHGQSYVACSRVGNPDNLFIYAETGTTKNIVYPQVLEN